MAQRGFSVTEAVVVIAIISLFSLIATPPLLQWKRNAQLRSMTFHLAAGLQLARNYALQHRELVVISFEEDGYRVFADNGDGGAVAGDWLLTGSERQLLAFKAKPGVRISSNFPNNRFRFKGFGRNQPGTVTVQGSGSTQKTRVVVSAIGRIRTEAE